MRVAVVGAGVSGCSCALELVRLAQEPIAVSLFEMGRGGGGRAATRRSRDLPDLALNHGAPVFHHSHSNSLIAALLAKLLDSKVIQPWNGSFGKIDARTGALGAGQASRKEPEDPSAFVRYVGSPGMSALADGILKLKGNGDVQTFFGTKVKAMKPCTDQASLTWELLDAEGSSLGNYDWLVVTSASMAHGRWRQTFAEDPPMQVAADLLKSPQLTSAVEHVKGLDFEGVHVAMMAWKVSDSETESDIIKLLNKLPFDITEVSDDDTISKIVRQSMGPTYASVILHSTASLSAQHCNVYGSGGSAALNGAVGGSPKQESEIIDLMFTAFRNLLRRLGDSEVVAPTWGPILHRWGSAFPDGSIQNGDQLTFPVPDARVSFAGDFLRPSHASIETAMSSGIMAAQQIIRLKRARQYVDLANQHDREGLLAMLANPCDMFGEPASKEGIDWYFDTYEDVHFEMTSQFQVSPNDPRTIELAYIRSWKDGEERSQVEVKEFFSFSEDEALIERIGYLEPPTKPVKQTRSDSRI